MKQEKSKNAFTLAEVLITLAILGVVASITIPSVINKQSDISAQTKLKKTIATYEKVTSGYFAESGKNDLNGWLGDNCENADSYFKIVAKNSNKPCQFLTSDGTFWVFNGSNGAAKVFDAQKNPRYGLIFWVVDGNVNAPSKASIQLPLDSEIEQTDRQPFKTPVHGIYTARTFMKTNSSYLSKQYGFSPIDTVNSTRTYN